MYGTIKLSAFLTILLLSVGAAAQDVEKALVKAFTAFENDPQLQSALSSLHVVDARTGGVIFSRNASIGMAPASTQKIITAATAYELLGKGFQYATTLGYTGSLANGVLKGNLVITGSGDPTFGSWRYENTKRSAVLKALVGSIKQKGIKRVEGEINILTPGFSTQVVPGGWIWDDIGNYYGAGFWGLNWNENQYDLALRPGRNVGDSTEIVSIEPGAGLFALANRIRTGARGSGDNGYIYMAPYATAGYTEGTIPLQEGAFTISGSLPDPGLTLKTELQRLLAREGITFVPAGKVDLLPESIQALYTHSSPVLDSVIYWFLRRSINLYGEALLNRVGRTKESKASSSQALRTLKDQWKEKGVAVTSLNMVDGSGLSPLNRVTTEAQVRILHYAKGQKWFSGYYHAFPEFNGMKMKSGTIQGVKGYCGYHRSRDGREYIFSFLVNNYNGGSSALEKKMYKVLDELK